MLHDGNARRMSDVVRVMEQFGRAPAWASATRDVSGLDRPERRAVLGGDAATLARLAGGREEMRCLILTPDR